MHSNQSRISFQMIKINMTVIIENVVYTYLISVLKKNSKNATNFVENWTKNDLVNGLLRLGQEYFNDWNFQQLSCLSLWKY